MNRCSWWTDIMMIIISYLLFNMAVNESKYCFHHNFKQKCGYYANKPFLLFLVIQENYFNISSNFTFRSADFWHWGTNSKWVEKVFEKFWLLTVKMIVICSLVFLLIHHYYGRAGCGEFIQPKHKNQLSITNILHYWYLTKCFIALNTLIKK